MSDYYIRDEHKPVSIDNVLARGSWFSTADRVVSKTEITKDVTVSTVFLGLDHQYGEGPPLLFETLVFGGFLDGEMWRCSTWEEALAQHDMAVIQVLHKENGHE